MPPAARLADPATHVATPLAPGAGSSDVIIGFMPAWRGLPQGIGAGIESALNTMKELIDAASLDPMTTPVKLVKVNAGLTQDAAKAAANGAPGAPATISSGFASLMSTNAALTATCVSVAAVPGGEPAARTAYTQAIKAAAAAFSASAISGIAGMTDTHVCPQPAGPIPHGPGVVTKGSKSVWINNLPACREGDQVFEAAGGPDPIKKGCPTVIIGDDGGMPAESPADSAVDAREIEEQAQVQSIVAALVHAAAAGMPLVEVCPQCDRRPAAVPHARCGPARCADRDAAALGSRADRLPPGVDLLRANRPAVEPGARRCA